MAQAVPQSRVASTRLKNKSHAARRKGSNPGTPVKTAHVPPHSRRTRSASGGFVRMQGAHLPSEVVLHILSFLPVGSRSQSTLYSCCLVSRQWYSAAVPLLYAAPYLYGKNFDPFAATICPSINAHIRKSALAGFVRCLDMSRLVHQSSKSLTARVLGRTQRQLEEFIAPRASFAVNSFAALVKCRNLRVLDLTLLSEAPDLRQLCRTIGALPNLQVFRFPRCLTRFRTFDPERCQWAPSLHTLSFSGNFLPLIDLPPTVTTITISHCIGITAEDVLPLLARQANHLRSLSLHHIPYVDPTQGQPGGPSAFDFILYTLTHIVYLSIDVTLITPDFFLRAPKRPHPLEFLELLKSSSPSAIESQIFPFDINCAISERGLQNVRRIRTSKSVWYPMSDGQQGPEVEQLAALLEQLELEDWEREAGIEVRWVHSEDDGEGGELESESWEIQDRWSGRARKAGLWIFDDGLWSDASLY